jgi:hypothetical protein
MQSRLVHHWENILVTSSNYVLSISVKKVVMLSKQIEHVYCNQLYHPKTKHQPNR